MSINQNPMLAAQMISYAKGQENQVRFSSEERERKRMEHLKQEAEKVQRTQQKVDSPQKGILA